MTPIEKLRALRRIADLVDEGQERGEIAGHGGDRTKIRDADLGLPVPAQRLKEARTLRDGLTDDDITDMVAKRFRRENSYFPVGGHRSLQPGRPQLPAAAFLPHTTRVRIADVRVRLSNTPWYVHLMDETRRRELLISISDPAAADLFGKHRWCAVCGIPLTVQATGRPRVYCSKACQQTAYRQRTSRRVLLGRIVENTNTTN